ncbi:hypothetical protein IB642_05870 [Allofrancisella guangzhouensis]|uniref:Lipoprotein n=1 Tax=Allofrancisella guangzhouensis TaxID=594679 RepID=A0A0A8E1V2_9GAMM|nr:hypothetical protein [Allofrancisella guangzhouensis]AJC48190.1 hypothetical protein SD28_00185 [Allofrancisella guangzhouensis]MBK2027056.1 hypothetical protein [Allofrancisella guangzhouensis]MBK2044546.1 hypothetical protein [Allofrancisella guangzhouensis]MBK2046122.1 hypothetical protein [Allofrancisella guangzhouensis]
MRVILLFMFALLSGCAWYQGPEPMANTDAGGDALSNFYSGPTLPSGTADDGGNYDVTSFDNN